MAHLKKVDTAEGFDPSIPLGPDILSPARDALRLDGVLEASVLSPRIHRFLLDWARLRNVHSSSRLEGNPLELPDAERVLAEGESHSPQEEEILRLSRAYLDIHEMDTSPRLTVEDIVGLHGEVFQGILPDHKRPGKLKNETNGIVDGATGQLIFEATPPERTPDELEALLKWYYGDGQNLDPVVATGMFFVEFQAIHPFHDGNGRLGRLLNQQLLRGAKLKNVTLTPFDGIVFRRSEQYYTALRATNAGGNYHVWLRFYADTLRRAYRTAVSRGDLRPLLDGMTAGSERDILEWALTTGLEWFQRGDFPNPQGYADITLTTALGNLRDRGFLERRGAKRNTRYRLSRKLLKGLYEGKVEVEDGELGL